MSLISDRLGPKWWEKDWPVDEPTEDTILSSFAKTGLFPSCEQQPWYDDDRKILVPGYTSMSGEVNKYYFILTDYRSAFGGTARLEAVIYYALGACSRVPAWQHRVMSNLIGLHSHKGCLEVRWSRRPAPSEEAIFDKAWSDVSCGGEPDHEVKHTIEEWTRS